MNLQFLITCNEPVNDVTIKLLSVNHKYFVKKQEVVNEKRMRKTIMKVSIYHFYKLNVSCLDDNIKGVAIIRI